MGNSRTGRDNPHPPTPILDTAPARDGRIPLSWMPKSLPFAPTIAQLTGGRRGERKGARGGDGRGDQKLYVSIHTAQVGVDVCAGLGCRVSGVECSSGVGCRGGMSGVWHKV
jgi:hypothetical protein